MEWKTKKKSDPGVPPTSSRDKRAPGRTLFLWQLLSFQKGFSQPIGTPVPSPGMKGSEIVETLGFTPGRQPAPFKGLAPSLAAQAALQDISIGRLRLPELRVLRAPVQAIRATHREGWLGPQSRPLRRGSYTWTDPKGGRWEARNPTAHSQKGCCSHWQLESDSFSGNSIFSAIFWLVNKEMVPRGEGR